MSAARGDAAPAPRLLDLHPRAWPERLAAYGAQPFQGRNAARWVFRRGVLQWAQMTDLPASLRARLEQEQPLVSAVLDQRSEAGDGAVKVLLRYPDGARAEAVGMPGTRGRTLCISTQVGCPVRCVFCASGLDGLERNLSQGEILEQVLWLRREQGDFHRLVVMGMGEAGHNLDAVLGALDCLIDTEGSDLAPRRITLSTVGPRGALQRIAAWGRPVTLALSVHSADDALRHRLVPGVRTRALEETLLEADQVFARCGREYTIEYVLLKDVNDSLPQARALALRLRGRRCHVNLIPYNPVQELGYDRPVPAVQEAFAEALRATGLPVTLRRSLGGSQNAACGQLRRRQISAPPSSAEPC